MSTPEEMAAMASKDTNAVTLEEVVAHGRHLLSLRADLSEAERNLQRAKRAVHDVARGTLPEAMQAAGMNLGDKLEVDGESLRLSRVFDGAFPRDPVKMQDALDKLRQYDAMDIVSTLLTIPIPKGYEQLGRDILQVAENMIKAAGINAPVSHKPIVHHMTLKSFVNERLEGGEDCDWEALGLHMSHEVKVTTRRVK